MQLEVRTVRTADAQIIWGDLSSGGCCSVVGASNSGKSILLRTLGQPAARVEIVGASGAERVVVYIDLNMMVDLSEQGFYELVLRSIVDELAGASSGESRAAEGVARQHEVVASQASPFAAALSFNEGLMHVVEQSPRPVVLLLDEFDEPFGALDERVFLNLRALVDRYQGRLAVVTATNRPLGDTALERNVGEFCELFDFHMRHLGALTDSEVGALLSQWEQAGGQPLPDSDRSFLMSQAGGHPGLLVTAARVHQELREKTLGECIAEALSSDEQVRTECARLWNSLTSQAREALVEAVGQPAAHLGAGVMQELVHSCLLPPGAGLDRLPGLVRGFVERQRLIQAGERRGVRVDVQQGAVWVDGRAAPELTDSEYRLLLLLYGRLGKICDKYSIVEAVWGQAYVDEVDDARIDKLVSRLRQKIEPDPDAPHYLVTLRGRGYRLVSAE